MAGTLKYDYPNEPIGGDSPYYCCTYCKISDPEINGRVDKHRESCEWRIKEEAGEQVKDQIPYDLLAALKALKKELNWWDNEGEDALEKDFTEHIKIYKGCTNDVLEAVRDWNPKL